MHNHANLLDFMTYFRQEFGVSRPGDILWSHAVNGLEKFGRFLNNPAAMFIESDIRLSIKSGEPVAVHPPETESDLTFRELIDRMKQSKQGLKLDFKDPEILLTCLNIIKSAGLQQPVFLNADILQGTGANISKFSARGFVSLCRAHYPKGIFSIGWTTTADLEKPYNSTQVDEMLKLCADYDLGCVTFPVRACLMPKSEKELNRLLAASPDFTLTVWNNESVSGDLRDWIRNHTDPAKTFYDFIDDRKEPLRLW